MESNSFSHLHLITKPGELNGLVLGKTVFYSFIFDIAPNAQVNAVFRYIFSKENTRPFSITISTGDDYNGSDMERWLNKLYLILCHPLYVRDNGKLIIGILSNDNFKYPHQDVFQQVAYELRRQSFNVSFIDFNQLHSKNACDPIFLFRDLELSDEAFQKWYLDALEKSGSVLQIFVLQRELETVKTIIKKIESAEKRILEETPFVYKTIHNAIAFSTKKKELELTIENLKQELATKKKYLDYFLGKNDDDTINGSGNLVESMKIKKFYHQEYEVLPLWYKRIGHIIKVITGKRTFRSLYDDKAPKYNK